MVLESINIKMVTILKEIISKTKNEERVSTTSMKDVLFNHNLIPLLHKFQEFNSQMEQFTLVNRETVPVKVQERQIMWMEVFMKVNGKTIKSMEMVSFPMLMVPNTTVNGKQIFGMVLVHTIIQMEINMKVTGIMILKKVWEPTITQMVTFIKVNGSRENQMDRAITSTKVVKPSTKVIGVMVKNKDLVS